MRALHKRSRKQPNAQLIKSLSPQQKTFG
ncbi:hypothetical protein FMEAI12_2090007 [Parafrankia sp. Ea1.12]|nr:hypothetical protein FMEAI12_2090007 [Parafrankia sp. Ea1.12]